MTLKNTLDQYCDLLAEHKEVTAQKERLERQIAEIEEQGEVVDSVTGGSGGTQHFTITGFPYPEYSRKKTLLFVRMQTLNELEIKIEQSVNDVESFLTTIDSSWMRRIVRLRFIEKLPWNEVANRIGGGNTEDSVKKSFYRYMEKESCPTCPEKK